MASFGILANKDRLEAEIAEAKKSVTRQKRIDRELSRVASGGRASSFLKKEAEKDDVLAASVALAAATDPLSYGNALINYQNAINPVNISDDLKTENAPVPKIPEEGGGGGGTTAPTCIGLNLYVRTVEGSQQVWISSGTVAGEIPSGFDPADGKNIANGGSGIVWARVNINETTGEVVSVAVENGATTPEDTSTAFHYTLGAYSYDETTATATSYGCGSLEFTVCRNWFVAQPPYFTADFTR